MFKAVIGAKVFTFYHTAYFYPLVDFAVNHIKFKSKISQKFLLRYC